MHVSTLDSEFGSVTPWAAVNPMDAERLIVIESSKLSVIMWKLYC